MTQFITSLDIVTYLNGTQVDENTYKIFGIEISKSSLEAHASYANDYVTQYTGNIDQTSSNWIYGKLAALNLAAMKVIVIISGGAFENAFNFRLGEFTVNRDPQLRQLLANSLKVFQEEFRRALNRLTSNFILISPDTSEWIETWEEGEVIEDGLGQDEV